MISGVGSLNYFLSTALAKVHGNNLLCLELDLQAPDDWSFQEMMIVQVG